MSEFNNEMFTFLTEEEHFKGLLIAKDQYPIICKQLIENLWNKTKQLIEEYFKDKKEWIVEIEPNIFVSFSKLYIYHKNLKKQAINLPPFFLGWENLAAKPYYGFWINMKSEEYKKEKIRVYIKEKTIQSSNEFIINDEWWWPIYRFDNELDLKDNKDDSLLKILPNNVDNEAQRLANSLINLFDKMQDIYLEIMSEFKNQSKTDSNHNT